jgi:hypothetical protein
MKNIHILLFIIFIVFINVIIYNLSYDSDSNSNEIDYFSMLEPFANAPPLDPKLLEKERGTSEQSLQDELKKLTANMPKKEETKVAQETDPIFLCNQETEKNQIEKIKESKKKPPCNMSIQKKFMYSCKPMNAFPIGELDKNVDLLEDSSQYYKNLHSPIKAVMDEFEYLGSNMPDYSNFAKISEIGRIQLDIDKVHPVPQNVAFKNSPAFDFI